MSTIVKLDFTGGGITNEDISVNAAIAATKVIQQFPIGAELYDESTTIVALASRLLHIVRGVAGTIVGFEGIITTVATGADRTVDVDLQKSTGGGAFATILTTRIQITNTSVIRTAEVAVISDTGLVDGDILRAVVTVAGAAAAQAKGLLVTLTMQEDA